jgi:hypothetical protein
MDMHGRFAARKRGDKKIAAPRETRKKDEAGVYTTRLKPRSGGKTRGRSSR